MQIASPATIAELLNLLDDLVHAKGYNLAWIKVIPLDEGFLVIW